MTYQTAVFAAGCFWCVEAQFQRVKGVQTVKSGYAGGERTMITYEQVKSGSTGHHEVINISYDPQTVSYSKLLDIFFAVHDPTQKDGQGEDIGSQYLSAIFYLTQDQKEAAIEKIQELMSTGQEIVTKVRPLEVFYLAEDYHQNYWNTKGSENAYCSIIPGKLAKLQALFKDYYVESS